MHYVLLFEASSDADRSNKASSTAAKEAAALAQDVLDLGLICFLPSDIDEYVSAWTYVIPL